MVIRPRASSVKESLRPLRLFRAAFGSGLLLLVLGGGCSSSTERTPQEQFTQEFIAGAIVDAGDFQANILSDGKVDFAEYERSVLTVMSCLTEEGLEVRGPPVLEPDGYTYIYFYRAPEVGDAKLSDAQVNGKYNSCYSRFGELVDSVWFAQNAKTIGDPRQ
ncbi:hypothetical protein MNBD_ACTINO02-2505 [hydrothermal vent metagenome]|uniref:Uncharacterized protein n=1 Tax=hydrothermal vent metagenome TaxID=652676 RepID=A0A3B0SVU7_9ZZZZ